MCNFLAPFCSYLIGSIPFAYLVPRVLTGVDIRREGSGNVGATNVARVLGWRYGAAVFILDMLKGLLPVFLVTRHLHVSPDSLLVILCGAGAICGHVFPVYLGFKGGKAAATSCGVFLWLTPKALAVAVAVWIAVVVLTRYVSLGTILASLALPAVVILWGENPFGTGRYLGWFCTLAAVLVVVLHRSNIGRLISGTEHKIGQQRS